MKVLFVDFVNVSPHIETSLELAKLHLDRGDSVRFEYLGHDVPFKEHSALGRYESALFAHWLPERTGARLLKNPRFTFVPRVRIPRVTAHVAEPDSLMELMSTTYDGADVGMGVASSLISTSRNSQFDVKRHKAVVATALASSIATYEYCLKLFAREKPDRVYIFNGRLCNPRAAWRAAQKLGLDVRIHDRGADMYRFVERPISPHDRVRIQEEMLWTWNNAKDAKTAEALAREWYEERRAGSPKDWFSFTALQSPHVVPDLPTDKRIVTYFSSSDDELRAIGENFAWQGWDDQLHAVESLIDHVVRLPGIKLVIRLHPHLLGKHPDDLARWRSLASRSSNVLVVDPASPVDTYALIDSSDLVLSGGSTVGMEAVYWGKPSILLGPSDYDLLGAVYMAHDTETLLSLLTRDDLSASQQSALVYGHYRKTFGTSFTHFRPHGLVGGEFLGVNLHVLPLVPRLVHNGKLWLLDRLGLSRSAGAPVATRTKSAGTA